MASFIGEVKKIQEGKISTSAGVLWRSGGFEVWPGMEEKQEENDLEMWKWPWNEFNILQQGTAFYPDGAVEYLLTAKWPTATGWNQSLQIALGPADSPSQAGPQHSLLQRLQQTAPCAGLWGTMSQPLCVSLPLVPVPGVTAWMIVTPALVDFPCFQLHSSNLNLVKELISASSRWIQIPGAGE